MDVVLLVHPHALVIVIIPEIVIVPESEIIPEVVHVHEIEVDVMMTDLVHDVIEDHVVEVEALLETGIDIGIEEGGIDLVIGVIEAVTVDAIEYLVIVVGKL